MCRVADRWLLTGRLACSGGRGCRQASELAGVVACVNIDISPFADDVATIPSQGTSLHTVAKPSSGPGLPVDLDPALGTLQIMPEIPAFDPEWYLRS